MANPQLEDGHTRIANELLEQLMKRHLSPNQWRVLLCIIRKTYGFQKKVDYIANKQIVDGTKLCKAVVSRALHTLQGMNVITRTGKLIGFQKDWEQWKLAGWSTSLPSQAPRQHPPGWKDRSRESHKVSAWQAKVFHRDNLTCRVCDRNLDELMPQNLDLHAHHILDWASHPELRYDTNNGLTICDECHYVYHYADQNNTYKYLSLIEYLRKLAGQSTLDTKLAELQTKFDNQKLAIQSKKVSRIVNKSCQYRQQKLAESSTKLAELSTEKVSNIVNSVDDIVNKHEKEKRKCTKKKEKDQKKLYKRKYGQFQNVLLTADEYQKLKDRFNHHVSEVIEELSLGIESKGYKYNSHYAAILNWQRRANAKAGSKGRELPKTYTPEPEYPD